MIKNDLTKSVGRVKNPYIQIIIYGAIIIIGALAGVIVYQSRSSGDVQKKTYDAVVESNRQKDSIINVRDNRIEGLNNRQYQYVLNELENERQRRAIKTTIDSLKSEQIIINKILKSK